MKATRNYKTKNPLSVGRTFVKPCLLKTVKSFLWEDREVKMRLINLSTTIQKCISGMSEDMKE